MAGRVREVAYVGLEAVLGYCCGLDVHKKKITACLLVGPVDQPPKELLSNFTTTTKGLNELRDWLASNGCTCFYRVLAIEAIMRGGRVLAL